MDCALAGSAIQLHLLCGLYALSAENGDDLGLHILHGDRAVIPAVLCLGPVVAQDEHMTLRNGIGIGNPLPI